MKRGKLTLKSARFTLQMHEPVHEPASMDRALSVSHQLSSKLTSTLLVPTLALMLAACTSSTNNSNLDLSASLDETLQDAANQEASAQAGANQEDGNILALNEDGTDTTALPTNENALESDAEVVLPATVTSPIPSPVANQQVAILSPQSDQQIQTANEPLNAQSSDSSILTEMKNAKIESAGDTAPQIATAPNAPFATPAVQTSAPKRKLNFFERLLKAQQDKREKRRLALLPKTQTATTTTKESNTQATNTQSSNTPKSGADIFNITADENDNHDEQTPPVEVASVGALGRINGLHGLILQTESVQVSCFVPELVALLKRVEGRFGKKVMVTSGYRSPARNRRAGGVKNSTHTYCKAADIQVKGVSKWDIAKYVRTLDQRGGVGTYCRTQSVHVDIGSQRDWHHPCRRRKSRK
ncbi:MAG: D-Ala-D-Ala carboxypeptidase family metallohydrolase [Nitratireductor sp.]